MSSVEFAAINSHVEDHSHKLPASLDYQFPSGNFSVIKANEYMSQYTDEYFELYKILHSKKLKKYFKTKEEEILFKKFPDLGTADSLGRIMCSFIASNDKISIPYMQKEKVSLVNILEQTRILFFIETFCTLMPLFLTIFIDFFTGENYLFYQYKSCSSSPVWHIKTLSSFNQSCSNIPIKMIFDNYPSIPVKSGEFCDGIASGVKNVPNSALFPLVSVSLVPVLWLLFAYYLGVLEIRTKKFIRVSIGLNGVYIPCTDKSKTLSSKNYFKKWPLIVKWHLIVITIVLTALQTLTIFSLKDTEEDWYVFPSFSAQVNFTRDATYSNYMTAWCGGLPRPVHLTYSKYSPPIATQILQSVLNVYHCYQILSHLSKAFKWMDPEVYMVEEKKELCSYYDIHQNRIRVFNEPILYDWFVINIQYPIVYSILFDSKYTELRESIPPPILVAMTSLLHSIASKYVKINNIFSDKNPLATNKK